MPEITYTACEEPILTEYTSLGGDKYLSGVLGAYQARFEDGLTVMWTHQGTPGTVGAWPLDPEDPVHYAILQDTAARLRERHDAG